MENQSTQQSLKDAAWIGDAVLALYTRKWLLGLPNDPDFTRQELFTKFTSNAFLNSFGEPTKVEAEIGRIYQNGDLTTAFDWIESNLVSVFKKQLANQRKKKRALS